MLSAVSHTTESLKENQRIGRSKKLWLSVQKTEQEVMTGRRDGKSDNNLYRRKK